MTKRNRRPLDREQLFKRLTEIGIALSAEKNIDRLLETILVEAKRIANADGGTIYLYEDSGDKPVHIDGLGIDRRSGGHRRDTHMRRDDVRDGSDAAPASGDRRRDRTDRRAPTGRLKFAIVRNDSLGIAMGGTTGQEIPFPPLVLHDHATGESNIRNVAGLAALTGETVNIPDAYADEEFDFSGAKAFDEANDYRSISFLTIPMKNKAGEVIGVLQLINAHDEETGEICPFEPEYQQLIEALASQAAVSLDNQLLIDGQRVLLDSFIQLIASAIDKKSPYTGGHCERVPVLTEMLAAAACVQTDGPFKGFHLDADEKYELHIAGWMHDCGKVTTPEYIVDKATKLETIYDRIETIKTRFEVLKRDTEIACLTDIAENGADRAARESEYRAQIARIEDDCAYLETANVGGEFMDDDKKDRVKRIAKLRWRGFDGVERDFLDDNEVDNLCIGRGTLTAEERQIINDHIVVTISMLGKLPFPKGLTRVPEYAGGHHEKMDGTGYPRGLTREQMSIPARMMAIADIFEALTAADRPYKNAKTLSASMGIMARMCEENHIDRELFELFVDAGVYRQYADRFLLPEQIDEIDHDALLGRKAKAR